MKKNLRLLCLGLAAATFTCGFAQDDKTSLLQNADMEQGLKGWVFDGAQLLGKNTKNPVSRTGFYGMNNGVLEAWNANGNGLADSYIKQRLVEMPEGTYVFGAYIGASKQGTQWENRDSVVGVSLFANESEIPVATENPDMNYKYAWGHSAKFNVAVTLTGKEERPGFLDLGLRYNSTNANYVVWDNATLYFFGDMTEEEALDAMAEIDMDNIVAIADTLTEGIVMNEDTLKALKGAIDLVKKGKTTAATLWKDSEDLFWQMGLARKSASDYASLKKSLDFAKVVYGGNWSDAYKDFYYDKLEYAIEDAESAYEDKEADRAELANYRKELDMYAGFMRLDSVNIALTELNTFIREGAFTNLPGDFTSDQKAFLEALAKEVSDTMAVVEAYGAVDPRPQDIYPYMQKIYDAIEEVKSNPYDGAWLMTLPRATAALNGYKPLEGTELDSLERYTFTSPLIQFKEPVELVRLTVTKSASDAVFFTLSALEFYDKDGNRIALDNSSVSSNADHNNLPGNGKDGGGLPALVDDDPNTYFHSDWGGKVADPHYLEVALPNGGYDALTFKMIARGKDHRHQFPAEIIITTPVVKRGLTAVEAALNDAKALNPYAGTDPGFYTNEFTALMDAMRQAEAILANYTSEEDCNNVVKALRAEIDNFNNAAPESKVFNMPVAGKTYRFISAAPFYSNQGVEKALTIRGDSALYWENVCADSLMQEFVLEEILNEDDELDYEVEEIKDDAGNVTASIPVYFYRLKSKKSGLYVEIDSVKQSTAVSLSLVEETTDTVRLKSVGAGQWNLIVKAHSDDAKMLHTQGHGGGTGNKDVIVAWNEGINTGSAWFIREMPELPLTVLVEGTAFKSECFHFEPSNTITLTADKACAFDGLTLYDLYGSVIALDSVAVTGKTAVISLEKTIVACSFAFNNAEGVSSVEFNAAVPQIQHLQKAYDEAAAVAPVQGTEVAQYADLSAYNAAIATAEALLENGGSDEEMLAAIEALKESVESLEPNMPEEGKVYCIYSAVAFEKNLGYKMTLGAYGSSYLRWKNENALDLQQYWQFEKASVEQLKEAGMDSTACAFYIKNLANKKYIGELENVDGVTTAMQDTVADAMPFVINILGVDTEVSLDGKGQSGKRIHANNHGSGWGKGSNIVYWSSGAGTASAWNIVDAGDAYKIADLIDATDNAVDFIEIESTVVKGTYDLFGRRVVAPTAPGIYIIDGKKRVIK